MRDGGEREGVFDGDFAFFNVYSVVRLILSPASDLASSSVRRRLRPFAGHCRLFYPMTLEMALDVANFEDDFAGSRVVDNIEAFAVARTFALPRTPRPCWSGQRPRESRWMLRRRPRRRQCPLERADRPAAPPDRTRPSPRRSRRGFTDQFGST